MGLFDWFSKEGKFKRHLRRASDRDAQPEDREASTMALVEEGSPEAIYAVLKRFDTKLSQQMKDKAEKEWVHDLLLTATDKLDRPLDEWMERCNTFAWPLKLHVARHGEEATCERIFALLDGPVGKAAFEPGKRRELLIWLTEHPHPGAVEAVLPFLDDFQDDVRYAAAEVLFANGQDLPEEARDALFGRLTNPDEESRRLQLRIGEVFRDPRLARPGRCRRRRAPRRLRRARRTARRLSSPSSSRRWPVPVNRPSARAMAA